MSISFSRRFLTYCSVVSVMLCGSIIFAGQEAHVPCSSVVNEVRQEMSMLNPCVVQGGQGHTYLFARGQHQIEHRCRGSIGSGNAERLSHSIQRVQGYQQRLARCVVAGTQDPEAQHLAQELRGVHSRMKACQDESNAAENRQQEWLLGLLTT